MDNIHVQHIIMDRKKNGETTVSKTFQQLFTLFQLYNCSIQNVQAPQSFKTDLNQVRNVHQDCEKFAPYQIIYYDGFL